MKLVLATPLYPPEAGGPATFAKVLEEELPKHGWEVETVKFSDVRHLPKFIRHLAYAKKVKAAAHGADAVLALDPVSVGLPALWAARKTHVPFFVRVAGDYAWEQGVQRSGVKETLDEFVTRKSYPWLVRVLRRIQTRVAMSAVRVIVPSQYLKRIVSQWGVLPEKVIVAYNAAPSVQKETLSRPDVAHDYVVSIARLVPWKGMDAVIKACATFVEPRTLVIVGDGPERNNLEATARSEGMTERVVFTGNLSHEDTLRYLAHAQMLVLNTRYEGLSHLLLEACALGTPIATTGVGGNPEVVAHEETGLIFAYDDVQGIAAAVQRINTDRVLKEHISIEAQKFIAGFTKTRMVHDVVNALT